MEPSSPAPLPPLTLAKLFGSWDRDNEGTLSYREFSDLFRQKAARHRLSDAELECLFELLDFAGDGVVHEHEFVGFLESSQDALRVLLERFMESSWGGLSPCRL